jgi:hypothetical protein
MFLFQGAMSKYVDSLRPRRENSGLKSWVVFRVRLLLFQLLYPILLKLISSKVTDKDAEVYADMQMRIYQLESELKFHHQFKGL